MRHWRIFYFCFCCIASCAIFDAMRLISSILALLNQSTISLGGKPFSNSYRTPDLFGTHITEPTTVLSGEQYIQANCNFSQNFFKLRKEQKLHSGNGCTHCACIFCSNHDSLLFDTLDYQRSVRSTKPKRVT